MMMMMTMMMMMMFKFLRAREVSGVPEATACWKYFQLFQDLGTESCAPGIPKRKSCCNIQHQEILPNISKDALPMLATSNVIYKFVCCCNNSYVGRTSKRLGSIIRQHVPKYAIELFDNKVLPMQKETIRCMHQKVPDARPQESPNTCWRTTAAPKGTALSGSQLLDAQKRISSFT